MIGFGGKSLSRAALRLVRSAALGLCVAPAAGLAETPGAAPGVELASLGPTTRSMTLVASTGPAIRVASPAGFTLTSPVDFDIRIEARDNVPVAMETLRIDYRVGPVWKDITGRITGAGHVSGTRLVAPDADLPKGRHTVRISVSDERDRTTVAVVKFAVK